MSTKPRAVHVAESTRNVKGKTYTSYLLRRTYREGNQVKHGTVGNLSDLPLDVIDYIRNQPRGAPPLDPGHEFEILRSLMGFAKRRCRARWRRNWSWERLKIGNLRRA